MNMRIVGHHTYHLSNDGQRTLCGRVVNPKWGTNIALTESDIASITFDGADVDCDRCLRKFMESFRK